MIKKLLLSLIVLFGVFSFSAVYAKSYQYESIDVDITVNSDSTFDVVESFVYRLDSSFGYFARDISLKGIDHLSGIVVYDSQGNILEDKDYDLSHRGNEVGIRWEFERKEFNNELVPWKISYRVHGALGFFDSYDEIYYNAIFPDREAAVSMATVSLNLLSDENISARMFVGKAGSKNERDSYSVSGNTVNFTADNILPGQYLTVVASWPKGYVVKPQFYRNQLINLVVLFLALLFPIIALVRSYLLWRKEGKDKKINKSIIAEYGPPDDLPPAVIGVLARQRVDTKDILATVVDLAVRGYLRIVERQKRVLFFEGGKEYVFERINPGNDLKEFEKKIMDLIFLGKKKVTSDELRNNFYARVPKISSEIHKEVDSHKLFNGNISEIRKRYNRKNIANLVLALIGLAAFMFVVYWLGFGPGYVFQLAALIVSLVISFVISSIFAYYMPVISDRGLDLKWKALGFRQYLNTAERFRIGAETLETFSKLLPYAMIFGVEKKWAQRFDNFSYQGQGWYVPIGAWATGSPTMSGFTASFNSFASSMSSTFSSSPGGSGAGGAAGGGAGGGGGGAG